MLRGNSGSPVLPVFLDETQFQHQSNAANQLQLFGNMQAGCSVDPANYFGNEHVNSMIQSIKRSREMENISKKQKLQISLNYNAGQDEVDRSPNMPNPNPVSTGLRLSYDDDERNSSVTSASGSMNAAPSMILTLGDSIRTELDRQQEELDQFIKLQRDQLAKEVRDMKQKHVASVLSAIERSVSKKLREKDLEIESINQRNRELAERIKEASIGVHDWHHRAVYNEQIVSALRKNIQKVISQGKEGFGDSEVDDSASCNQGAHMKSTLKKHQGIENLTCRTCKIKEVSVLLMPCRHLCLCHLCDIFIDVCPVCQLIKTTSFQVRLC